MKSFKKILCLIVCILGSITWFVSCSCSSSTPNSGGGGTTPTPAPESGGGGTSVATYTIDYSIKNDIGGTVVSSTGANTHRAGDSCEYIVTPSPGFAVMTITINNATFYTHVVSGFSTSAVEIPFSSITKNYSIEVTFYQYSYFVSTTIDEAGYSCDEGTITEKDSKESFSYGDNATYEVSPNEGFCINKIFVDSEEVFDYFDDIEKAQSGVDIGIDNISSNHEIFVSFYRLFTPVDICYSFYYPSGDTEADAVEDNKFDSSSVELVGNQSLVPIGREQAVKLNVADGFNFHKIVVGLGYENVEINNPSQNFMHEKFVYKATDNTIEFSEFTNNTKVSIFAVPDAIKLLIATKNGGQFSIENANPSGVVSYVTDVFTLSSDVANSGKWYYATNSSFENWMEIVVEDSKILLEANMVINYGNEDTIILYYEK